jgi:hypothetical protein
LKRLVEIPGLDDREAAEEFLGLGERPVDHGQITVPPPIAWLSLKLLALTVTVQDCV